MEQRVSLVTLGVTDLARARAFYEGLGWTTRAEPGDDVVFFQAGGMVEALWDRANLAEDSGVTDSGGWGGVTLAYTTRVLRVLETSHPPVYYIPPEDIRMEHMRPSKGTSFCEWKGRACYYDVVTDEREESRAAWYYPEPVPAYWGLKDHVAFYPSKMDVCWVDGERVVAQEGDFYGGWITPEIAGPIKGGPGTWGW